MSRWWRAYDEAVDDPKLLLLSDRLHRAWFNVLCVASHYGGTLPSIEIVACKLRMPTTKAAAVITELTMAGLIDKDETGFVPHNWKGRQFQSDVSTSRVKKFRERQRNVSRAHNETPPENRVQNTEQSTSLTVRAKRRHQMPTDFELTMTDRAFATEKGFDDNKINAEFERFVGHARANGRLQIDWHAAWRNWVTSPYQKTGNGDDKRPYGDQRGKSGDFLAGLASLAQDGDRDSAVAGPGNPPIPRGRFEIDG